ncbi:hypothetical protein PRZ02_01960 [Thermoproteati archaeon 3817-70]
MRLASILAFSSSFRYFSAIAKGPFSSLNMCCLSKDRRYSPFSEAVFRSALIMASLISSTVRAMAMCSNLSILMGSSFGR